FGSELDHGPLVKVTDFDTLGKVLALRGELRHASARGAQLFAELAMGDLEAAHGRAALFGIGCGGDTVFPLELGEISACRLDLLIQGAALGIGNGTGRVLRLDLIIDQRIEQELFPHVLEEVLLPPAVKHAVGDLDVTQVPSTGNHLGLVTGVAQARDLPQAQLALEESHRLVVQKIIHGAPVELGATPNEAPLMDPTRPADPISQHVEAVLDNRGEKLRAPAAAIEDDG